MGNYGPEHRKAKEEKIASMGKVQCQVTGSQSRLNAHHNCPRLFNGPDLSANYVMLSEHFHTQVLHALCNVSDKELVAERVRLTNTIKKHILSDERVKVAKQRVDEIDDVLIDEYIHNTMNRLPHDVRETVIELTLIHSFKTIRDQAIRILQLEAKNEAI